LSRKSPASYHEHLVAPTRRDARPELREELVLLCSRSCGRRSIRADARPPSPRAPCLHRHAPSAALRVLSSQSDTPTHMPVETKPISEQARKERTQSEPCLSMLSRRPIQLPPLGRNDCGPGGRRGTIPYNRIVITTRTCKLKLDLSVSPPQRYRSIGRSTFTQKPSALQSITESDQIEIVNRDHADIDIRTRTRPRPRGTRTCARCHHAHS
jgi:hypothetical protein